MHKRVPCPQGFGQRAANRAAGVVTRVYQSVERPLNCAEVGLLRPHVGQLLLRHGLGVVTVGSVLQPQEPRNLGQTEPEPLCTLYEVYSRHVRLIVPAHRTERPNWLAYQAAPLIEPNGLDVHAGRGGQGTDRHTRSRHVAPLDSVSRYRIKLLAMTASRPSLPTSEPHAGSSTRLTLAAGALAALLASACCLGPLLLLAVGISGAWIGTLTALEPYRPVFVLVAVGALFLAHRRIYRPITDCKPDEVCAVPAVNRTYRALFWLVAALLGVALVYPYVAPLFY